MFRGTFLINNVMLLSLLVFQIPSVATSVSDSMLVHPCNVSSCISLSLSTCANYPWLSKVKPFDQANAGQILLGVLFQTSENIELSII